MKIFDMIDEELHMSLGCLLHYEKEGDFIVELREGLDEWTAPLLFTSLVKRGIYTVPREASLMWVKERVIPSDRQNIGDILTNHKLKAYDEGKLIEISEGRCAQDHIYIKKLDELPEYVRQRKNKNLIDCILCDDFHIMCFFADETVKKIDLHQFIEEDDIDKVLVNQKLFESGKITAGGYAVTFNDSIDLSARLLYDCEKCSSIKTSDFMKFVERNLLDTSDCCNLLNCTRQNLAYMVKRQQLHPVKEDVKGNLYLKGELLSG